MNQMEEIKVSRNATNTKNIALLKVVSGTLDSVFNGMGCFGDCEECVLEGRKEDNCIGSEIGTLRNKINKKLEEIEEEFPNRETEIEPTVKKNDWIMDRFTKKN